MTNLVFQTPVGYLICTWLWGYKDEQHSDVQAYQVLHISVSSAKSKSLLGLFICFLSHPSSITGMFFNFLLFSLVSKFHFLGDLDFTFQPFLQSLKSLLHLKFIIYLGYLNIPYTYVFCYFMIALVSNFKDKVKNYLPSVIYFLNLFCLF